MMKRLKSILDVTLTILVVIAAALVIWRQLTPAGSFQPRPRVEDVTGTIPAEALTITRGNGQVALVEFADFQCPFCARHAQEVEPAIQKAFMTPGILRHVFINHPLANHEYAQAASEASLCAASQGKFWQMHDRLFANQEALDSTAILKHAKDIGVDIEAISECLGKGEVRVLIERHKTLAKALGVLSTPVFFVGIIQPDGSLLLRKRLTGALPFDEFRDAIEEVTPRELRGRIGEVDKNKNDLTSVSTNQ
jgi:protein-disulfide isomerase